MRESQSLKALSQITDAGLFERLATAVLRESDPIYKSLTHPGANEDGQSVKEPIDCLCIVHDSGALQIVSAQHTICSLKELQNKWLLDPSTVKTRKGRKKAAAPRGDLLKVAEEVEKVRKDHPLAVARLALTTNKEPTNDLVLAVNKEARARKIEVDIWSRARLAHELDNTAVGQWLRRKYLDIEQELLSAELFEELSKQNLDANRPLDDEPAAWVDRELDDQLLAVPMSNITFVIAESGMGKSVACYKRLLKHAADGCLSLVIPHEIVASSTTVEQAIDETLRRSQKTLAPSENSVLSFCPPGRPLLIAVEDVNRSDQTEALIERILKWSPKPVASEPRPPTHWRLLCPVWPQSVSLLKEQTRKRVEEHAIYGKQFSHDEGLRAVQHRAKENGKSLSDLEAANISDALGHDPLHIALYDINDTPDPHCVLGSFITGSLKQIAAADKDHAPEEYLNALRELSAAMLSQRKLEFSWNEVKNLVDSEPTRKLIAQIAHQRKIMRFGESVVDQKINFRHDRVKDWLLIDAATELERRSQLDANILGDPYFSGIMGGVLCQPNIESKLVERVANANILALFHALKIFREPTAPLHHAVIVAIDRWLNSPQSRAEAYLRYYAARVLADTDSSLTIGFAKRMGDLNYGTLAACFRNGDVSGGIDLCQIIPPWTSSKFRDEQIEHAKLRFKGSLTKSLITIIGDLAHGVKPGTLHLAGYLGDPSIAPAIEQLWKLDPNRDKHLVHYIWAQSHCCGDEPHKYLDPLFDAWATLPVEVEEEVGGNKITTHPRTELPQTDLEFGFRERIPTRAIEYFVKRGQDEALREPIMCMVRTIDHPAAIKFMIEELAKTRRRLESTGGFSPFVTLTTESWTLAQERGAPMSTSTRSFVLEIWRNEKNDTHVREQAFEYWAATTMPEDLEILRAMPTGTILSNHILRKRLHRGDHSAIPQLLEKMKMDGGFYWLREARSVWSSQLTEALDELLTNCRPQLINQANELYVFDSTVAEMITRHMTPDQGQTLLLKHWAELESSFHLVQAALFLASPALLVNVGEAVAKSKQPESLFQHLHVTFGIKNLGRSGLTRREQIIALAPHLDLIDPFVEMWMLWEECNRNHWFDLRRKYIDPRMVENRRAWSSSRAFQDLDQMTNRDIWIDHWLEEHLAADVSRDELLQLIADWLAERKSIEALSTLSSALIQIGQRSDLGLLQIYEGMNFITANQIIENTQFAVRLRNLN